MRPYRTKNNLEHLLDIYADDLSIYLEYDSRRNWRNKENIREVLVIMEKFYTWSRLKINLGKTYVSIFGKEQKEPKFVNELKLKWCTKFKLLGIHFDVTLSEMQRNYQIGLDSIRKELYSWKFRHLCYFIRGTRKHNMTEITQFLPSYRVNTIFLAKILNINLSAPK